MLIRIFVGCSPDVLDGEFQCVLEYTLRKYASQPLDITWMKTSLDPVSPFNGWRAKFATPFSGYRYAIPSLCDYVGKAIYFDVDFWVNKDVAELWNQEFQPGKVVIAKGGNRYCCSMWDCAAAKGHVPHWRDLRGDPDSFRRMQSYFVQMKGLVQPFANGDWNALDYGIKDIDTPSAIHCTNMPTQPHLKYAVPRLAAEGKKHWYLGRVTSPHPNAAIQARFDQLYIEAQAAGYTVDKYR